MIKAAILVLLSTTLTPVHARAKDWRGITPLHSTRVDVERLLPRSAIPGDHASLHKLQNETVLILYASGPPCGKTLVDSWKVPKGTVVSISVSPRSELKFASLGLDLTRYQRTADVKQTGTFYYTNEEEGTRYTVHDVEGVLGGIITDIVHFPSVKDSHLRCDMLGTSKSVDQSNFYPSFQRYGDISFSHEKSLLDNFAAYLQNDEPDFKAYIVAYSGRTSGAMTARARAKRAKNYLVKVRGIKSQRVMTLYGGKRGELEMELYAQPRGLPFSISVR